MTDEEKKIIKEKIILEIEIIEHSLVSLKENSRPVEPDNAIGRLSRMEAINAKAISEVSLENAKVRLTKLKNALIRIDKDEDFGICFKCEEDIAIKRITALPETTLCLNCAE